MAEKSKTPQRIFLILVFLSGFAMIFLLSRMNHSFGTLPYYYPLDVVQVEKDGEIIPDTIWHTIPSFSFLNEENAVVTNDYIEGKVTVVDFFFTTCTTICPKMTRQMKNLVWELDEPYFADVKFLSFTVDPEYDTPEVLKNYAKNMEIQDERWTFLTGDKEKIYDLGVNGFKVTTQEDVNQQGNFLHSEKCILVDKDGHIRGYYDGTDPESMRDLEEDVKILVGMERKQMKRERR